MNNDFEILVSKRFSGEATEAELQALDQLLKENSAFRERYKMLQQFWAENDQPNQSLVEDGLQKVLARLQLPVEDHLLTRPVTEPVPGKIRFTWRRLSVAAGIIFLLSAAVITGLLVNKKDGQRNIAGLEKKQNSKGVKSTIVLADGSKIWLNADSKIEYPESFNGKTREITLNGEAFFEVAKNPSKPFIIHLENGTIRVLGTSFNVRAYDSEPVVETSVSTGKVAFIPKYKTAHKKQDTVFLTPDNKARYLFASEKILVAPTAAKEDKAWTEGRLIFKSMRLEEIAVELERNFGKKVKFTDAAAREYVLTGSFQNNSLEDILYYLSLSKTKKFYYKITNTELLIATKADKLE